MNFYSNIYERCPNMRNESTPDLHDSVQYSSSYITCTLRAKWNFRNSLLSKGCVSSQKLRVEKTWILEAVSNIFSFVMPYYSAWPSLKVISLVISD